MENYPQKYNPDVQICSIMSDRGPCDGDSGGPALVQRDDSLFSVNYLFLC